MIDRLLRNRFLNTAAFLMAPPDDKKAADDKGTDGDNNDDTGGADGAGEGEGEPEGQAEGGEGGSEGEGGDDTGAEGEDDELAGLTPELRAKVEKRLAKEIGWRDRQIDRLHAKRRSAEQDVDAARTIVERQPAKKPAAQGEQQLYTEEEVERRAQVKNAQTAYDDGCTETDSKGKKYYGDKWSSATGKLAKMGGVTVDDMVAILATDEPAVVLYSLASDPDEYERVMRLPPARRTAAFVKLGLKAPPRAVSEEPESKRPGDNPPPVRPLQGGRRQASQVRVDIYDDKADDDAWYKQRNETRRKKFTNVQ